MVRKRKRNEENNVVIKKRGGSSSLKSESKSDSKLVCLGLREITAFTLAEVLITLAVIGVIAAMTIPTLVSTYKKKIVETRLLRVYSVMNQAIRLYSIENGETQTWDTLGTSGASEATSEDVRSWFNKYFANYIQRLEVQDWENNKILVKFNDGSGLIIPNHIYDMSYVTDVKCLKNDSCIGGVSAFMFRFSPNASVMTSEAGKKTVKPYFEPYTYGWDGTVEGAKYSSGYGCYNGNRNHHCAKLIQLNGWKIPDDYPYKF